MKKKVLICVCLSISQVFGIGYYPPAGARALSMGGSGLMLADVFSPANNCALMTEMKKPGIGFSFTNRYALKDVNQVAICAVLPFKKIAYGFKLLSDGNNILSDRTIGFSFAHATSKQSGFGIGANYHHYNIRTYGRASVITIEFSLVANITNKLSSSFFVFNPFAARFKDCPGEHLQRTFRMGLLYKINKKISVVCEAEKSRTFRTNIKLACQYQLNPKFHFCIGFSSLQPQCTFGIGFKHKHYTIAYASSLMQAAGSSNNLSFIYEIGK